MPGERRAQLAKNLATFDALSADERREIRSFAARLQELDADTKDRYLGILRRYHLWRRSLTAKEKKLLDDAATPEARVRVVEQLRAEQRARQSQDPDRFDWIQISSLNDHPLFWTALQLKIWFLIDDKKRAEIAKIADRHEQSVKLREQAKSVRAFQAFKHMREEIEAEADAVEKEREKFAKARGQVAKAAAKVKAPFVERSNPLNQHQILRYLHDHKPAHVDPQHLGWFVDECPNWLRESLASLAPDDARRRMIILYRMVFPEGTEIPKPKPKAPSPKAAAAPVPKTSAPPKQNGASGVPL